MITIKLDLVTTIPVMEWIKDNENRFNVPYKVGYVFEDDINSAPLAVTKISEDAVQSIIKFYDDDKWFKYNDMRRICVAPDEWVFNIKNNLYYCSRF